MKSTTTQTHTLTLALTHTHWHNHTGNTDTHTHTHSHTHSVSPWGDHAQFSTVAASVDLPACVCACIRIRIRVVRVYYTLARLLWRSRCVWVRTRLADAMLTDPNLAQHWGCLAEPEQRSVAWLLALNSALLTLDNSEKATSQQYLMRAIGQY